MKYITLFLIYIFTFFFFFFLLSLLGLIWQPYLTTIRDGAWWALYSMFLGWWVAIFPAMEYYKRNEMYFNRI